MSNVEEKFPAVWLVGMIMHHRNLGQGVVVNAYWSSGGDSPDRIFVCFDSGAKLDFSFDILTDRSWFDNACNREFLEKLSQTARAIKILSPLYKFRVSAKNILNAGDIELCLAWSGSRRKRVNCSALDLADIVGFDEAARLLSARAAELAAIRFYESLGWSVVDISITQLKDKERSWVTHDLEIEARPIDVKNARKIPNFGSHYVGYRVPKFKRTRNSNVGVSVAAVLSEYRTARDAFDGHYANVFLGEISISLLHRLNEWLDGRFGCVVDWSGLWGHSFIPGWMFEYPPEFYKSWASALTELKLLAQGKCAGVKNWQIPRWALIHFDEKEAPLPGSLPAVDVRIANDLRSLRNKVGFVRPALFSYCLGLLLESIKEGDDIEVIVQGLGRNLLIAGELVGREVQVAGVYDPGNYIRSLIQNLKILSRAIQSSEQKFTGFRISHPLIVLGIAPNGRRHTLLAYCGRCAKAPLVLGVEAACEKCGKLICENCKYCSDYCWPGNFLGSNSDYDLNDF